MIYLDTSATLRLVMPEAETAGLELWIAERAGVLVSMDDVAATAEVIGEPALRSLDAIHLATAHELRTELTAFLCYDKRLGDSARALGLPVESPA
jgi:uncharacterized protein